MKSLTIVVTDANHHGKLARQIASGWTTAGLLGESVWLSPNDVIPTPVGPPHVTARLLNSAGEGPEEDLFRIIGVRRLEQVRIVLAQFLPAGDSNDNLLSVAGRHITELVKDVLPRPTRSGAGVGGTKLRRINLLIPESGTAGAPPELLQAGWEVNAIVSPEDRPGLDHSSVFVRESVNFHAHGVAAVAAAGGLWSGVPQGAFDTWELDSTSGASDLVVIRHSCRMLIGDDLPDQLTDAAMRLVLDPTGGGAGEHVKWAATSGEPEKVVSQALEDLAARGEWARDELSSVDPPVKSEMGIATAFSDLARFQLRLVLAAIRVFRRSAARLVEKTATGMTAGHDGDYVVRIEPRHPDDVLAAARRRLNEQASSLRGELLEREASKIFPPAPETWGELRDLCFGLVDGGALPTGFTTPERAGVREILPAVYVAPPPLGGESTTPPGEAPAIEGETASEDELQASCASLEDRSLLNRLADSVGLRKRTAEDTAEASYEEATGAYAPPIEDVRRARGSLMMGWILIALLTLAIGTWSGIQLWLDLIQWPQALERGGWLLLIDAILALAGGISYYRALRNYEWKIRRLMVSRRAAGERYVVARRESRRLDLLYSGLVDWSQIIGWVLHSPWDITTSPASADEVDLENLPASVGVAVPSVTLAQLPAKVTHECVRAICHRGYAAQIFDEIVARVNDFHEHESGRGHIPADLDTGLRHHGPRRLLLAAVASPELRSTLAELARQRVARAIADGGVQLPPRDVRRVGQYASPEPVADSGFLSQAADPGTPFVDECWTDTGRLGRRHIVHQSVAWLPSSRAESSEDVDCRSAHSDCAMRVDYSERCQPSDVALLATNTRRTERAVSVAGDWN